MSADPAIQERQVELVHEAQVTLAAIRWLADDDVDDPLSDPQTLARAVTSGILDAPQLRNNPFGRGEIRTRVIHGACMAVGGDGKPLSEAERLVSLKLEDRR